jgi:hypothetical protein
MSLRYSLKRTYCIGAPFQERMHTAKLQKKSSKNAVGKLLFFSESIFQFTFGLNRFLCKKVLLLMHGGGWGDGD